MIPPSHFLGSHDVCVLVYEKFDILSIIYDCLVEIRAHII